jgi:hypothetical protein
MLPATPAAQHRVTCRICSSTAAQQPAAYLVLQVWPQRLHQLQALLRDAVQHLAVHDDGALCLEGGWALGCSDCMAPHDPLSGNNLSLNAYAQQTAANEAG